MQRLLKHSAITDVQYTSDATCAIKHIYPESLTYKTNYNFKLAKKKEYQNCSVSWFFYFLEYNLILSFLTGKMLLWEPSLDVKRGLSWFWMGSEGFSVGLLIPDVCTQSKAITRSSIPLHQRAIRRRPRKGNWSSCHYRSPLQMPCHMYV